MGAFSRIVKLMLSGRIGFGMFHDFVERSWEVSRSGTFSGKRKGFKICGMSAEKVRVLGNVLWKGKAFA